jgi:hypothetical protein
MGPVTPQGGQFDALGLPRLRGYKAAADTDGMMQSHEPGRTRPHRVGFVMALSLLAGCSTYHGLFALRPAAAASWPAATTTSVSSAAVSQRFALFGFGEGDKTRPQAAAPTTPPDIDCPGVEIRQGASTVQQSAADNGSVALSLRYQANFVRFARECALRAGNVVMKVGVEGRVILGPAGTAGPVTLPVRLAVVKEGLEPKTIWTKFYMVPVVMPPGQPNVLFTHVEEDMSFPNPPGDDLDKYVVYVGFDPDSAVAEKKKPPPPKKPKR